MSEDPKYIAQQERRTIETERGLRQFLKLETGLGNSKAFQRGWVFAYEFTEEQRAMVNLGMEEGLSFEDAFDAVARR